MAAARHRARHDPGDRDCLVPPGADRLVRLVQLPPRQHRQRRVAVSAHRGGSADRGGWRPDRPSLDGPGRRLAGPARGVDRVLGDPARDHPPSRKPGAPPRIEADADARERASMTSYREAAAERLAAAMTSPMAT